MQIARIATTLLLLNTTRRPAQKFSPGLPQNQTCGCWSAPANHQTFDIVLNASWVVTGFAFSSQRARWLREFDIQASDDNRTFLPWGAFVMSNFTAAALAVFAYPVRARFFRVTVRKYANHYVNASTGFVLTPVHALVSQDQPFRCACPMLSSGACCPFINMTVRNDTCVWCMDPAELTTRMADGCGKCKPGTFEHAGKCYASIKPTQQKANSLSIGNPVSNGVNWSVDVNFTVDPRSMVQLFVAGRKGTGANPHPCWAAGHQAAAPSSSSSGLISTCCLRESSSPPPPDHIVPIFWNFTPPSSSSSSSPPTTNSTEQQAVTDCPMINSSANPPSLVRQFVQFDRGRNTLTFTQAEIRSWAACDTATGICTGIIGALFITAMQRSPHTTTMTAFLPQLIQQPLRFDLGVPPLVCTTLRNLPTMQARAEVHHYAATEMYTVRILGAELKGDAVSFQWTSDTAWSSTANAPELVVSPPPGGASLRITDAITTLRIDPPITPVVHGAVHRSTHAGILVQLRYGFGFSALPSPGDTDQIIIVTAHSTQPVRLRRLATTTTLNGGGGGGGEWQTTYTTSRGFISDARRVLDLTVACYQAKAALSGWLLQALQMLDTERFPHTDFVQRSCRLVFSGEAAKAFWLVPFRGPGITDRTAPAGVDVIAEFA
jgi:hypothetical protein